MTSRAVGRSDATEAAVGPIERLPPAKMARCYAIRASRVAIGILVIVACYLGGEWLTSVLRIPVPGAVVGMVLLIIVLCIQPVRFSDRVVVHAGEKLIGLIPFLLVPAAVGVVTQLANIARDAPALVASVVGGWIVTLLVTAVVAKVLLHDSDKRNRKTCGPS